MTNNPTKYESLLSNSLSLSQVELTSCYCYNKWSKFHNSGKKFQTGQKYMRKK